VAAEDELTRLIERLESLGDHRQQLDALDEETRLRLLRAAGAIARPSREALKDASRARRRARRDGRRTHDATLLGKTGMRASLRERIYAAPPEETESDAPRERLTEPRACYVCKADFVELHAFYDSLCPECARLNYARRFPRGDLSGRIALVTGARVKIGFQTAVVLLRQGARVLVTTRFPRDAAQRFAALPDFAGFADRLSVYGLDLRHIPSVELFAAHLSTRHPHLDILINNAAQTVRRPAGFYAHLLPLETQPVESLPAWRSVLADHVALAASIMGDEPGVLAADRGLLRFEGARRAVGLTDSAALSQLTTADELAEVAMVGDRREAERLFPRGQLDVDLQQVDLRPHNSWRMTAPEVSTGELLEVHLVNAVAPFVLCARLRPLLERSPHDARFIVNVSAMEAQFSRRKKTDKHPHTNMAKAALNMLTRTSAADYAEARIYMNSVDTGWVTDEDPLHHVVRKQEEHRFHPPLDVVDGAARIVDPIFSSLDDQAPPFGLFFKDYRVVPW
jgi:NAD(P)-dependent dehydrogenase (short-subunit alcohol dehydrogenase family)